MKSSIRSFALFLPMLFLFTSCEKTTPIDPVVLGAISGVIKYGASNLPLADVTVSTIPASKTAVSGADGSFSLPDIPAGSFLVKFEKTGYNNSTRAVTLNENESRVLDVTVFASGPELDVTPSVLDFSAAVNSLSFKVFNKTDLGTVTYQINETLNWLFVSPQNGTASTDEDQISVTVFRDSISVGSFSGVITVASDYGTKEIQVTIAKTNPGAPQLSISPVKLDFGTYATELLLTVRNTGTGTLFWDAQKTNDWIQLPTKSGSLTTGTETQISVTVTRAGEMPVLHEGTIRINWNSGSVDIPVKMGFSQGSLPAPTLNLNDEPSTNEAYLKWTTVDYPEFESYRVYRSALPDVDEQDQLVGIITNKLNVTFTDASLSESTEYFYKVFVYSVSGIGNGSNELHLKTKKNVNFWTSDVRLIGTGQTANALFALSNSNVWVVGDSIYHFTGFQWESWDVPSGSKYLRGVSFVGSMDGWAVGDDKTVLHFDGFTWTKITDPLFAGQNFFDVAAISAYDVWVAGSGALFHYDGFVWSKIILDAYWITDIDYINDNLMWAVDYDGKLFRYDGFVWTYLGDAQNATDCTVSGLDENTAWISSAYYNNGLIYFDGANFIYHKGVDAEPDLLHDARFDVEMISATEGWSSFPQSKLSFYDGTLWWDVTSPVTSSISCIKMLNADNGWAVSQSGDILRYQR